MLKHFEEIVCFSEDSKIAVDLSNVTHVEVYTLQKRLQQRYNLCRSRRLPVEALTQGLTTGGREYVLLFARPC